MGRIGKVLMVSLLVAGCQKKQKGCTNPNALNYCYSCNVKGTCEYLLTLSFWMPPETRRYLDSLGYSLVDFVISRNDGAGFKEVYRKNLNIKDFDSIMVGCEYAKIQFSMKYRDDEVPCVCDGKGGIIGGSSCSRCYVFSFNLIDTTRGIVGWEAIVTPGETCRIISLSK